MPPSKSQLPSNIFVPSLQSGGGHQFDNKATATAFIATHLFNTKDFDGRTGVITTGAQTYRVAAQATDGDSAMIGTPNNPCANIQSHDETALMCRQTINVDRSPRWVVYEVDPQQLPLVVSVAWMTVEDKANK